MLYVGDCTRAYGEPEGLRNNDLPFTTCHPGKSTALSGAEGYGTAYGMGSDGLCYIAFPHLDYLSGSGRGRIHRRAHTIDCGYGSAQKARALSNAN